MASSSNIVSLAKSTQTPYQLNIDQTLKASTALLRHVKEEAKRLQELSSKKNLLAIKDEASDSEGGATLEDDQPIWLSLTTKQQIVDKSHLKPSKIPVPHSLNKSGSLSICIIAADPQRALKNVLADPTFPKSLSGRIEKVIGYSKLKARYKTFESRRQLLTAHDIFLADDRIISRLVETLGKIFYKGTSKRPIPIRIAKEEFVDGKRVKHEKKKPTSKDEKHAEVASPAVVAKAIESALNAVPVSLRPGTNVAVRVGKASFTPQQLSVNIHVVANGIIEKHVVKGWRNVKSMHIKTPTSAALPIWLADDLWVGEDKVMDNFAAEQQQQQQRQPGGEDSKSPNKKRKATSERKAEAGAKKVKVAAAGVPVPEDAERELAKKRKVKLERQKAQALQTGGD